MKIIETSEISDHNVLCLNVYSNKINKKISKQEIYVQDREKLLCIFLRSESDCEKAEKVI